MRAEEEMTMRLCAIIAIMILIGNSNGENIVVSISPSDEASIDLRGFNVTLVDVNQNRYGPRSADTNGKASFGILGCPCDITASKIDLMLNGKKPCYYGHTHVGNNPGYVQVPVKEICDCSTSNCACCQNDIATTQTISSSCCVG